MAAILIESSVSCRAATTLSTAWSVSISRFRISSSLAARLAKTFPAEMGWKNAGKNWVRKEGDEIPVWGEERVKGKGRANEKFWVRKVLDEIWGDERVKGEGRAKEKFFVEQSCRSLEHGHWSDKKIKNSEQFQKYIQIAQRGHGGKRLGRHRNGNQPVAGPHPDPDTSYETPTWVASFDLKWKKQGKRAR